MYNSLGSWHPALCKHLRLEFARKPPLAQTWPHQIGSDWKIAPIKAVSFRGTGLHFWEAFSGCLQWLWGSAVLPCLRQNPKCLTTRHTILGHRGGSTPSPRQGRLCVCLIRYVAPPPPAEASKAPHLARCGMGYGTQCAECLSGWERGWNFFLTPIDNVWSEPRVPKAMPASSHSCLCYFWSQSPCSQGCIQTPIFSSSKLFEK